MEIGRQPEKGLVLDATDNFEFSIGNT